MSLQHKTTVIQRLRHADEWLAAHGGAPAEWIRSLLRDAAQELESESGSLWAQWMTGRDRHIRVFVKGPMGLSEIDSLMEFLALSRKFAAAWESAPQANCAVDPVAGTGQIDTTRAAVSSSSRAGTESGSSTT